MCYDFSWSGHVGGVGVYNNGSMSVVKYDHNEVEKRWRDLWLSTSLNKLDISTAKKPYYNLMMFPYPSAEGLHVGNMYAFTGSDIYGRYKRMQGYDVFEPIGLDGFGIHSENHALKTGVHPMEHAAKTEANFYNQLKTIGAMFDWDRTVQTYDPDYYRWTQWIFVQMFKHGLAYRGKASVNWCPSDKTVLADEQVIDGKCERCGNTVEKRLLEQWFFRITEYAGKLLSNISSLDWSEKVKVAQTNWIGKKEGINIDYPVVTESDELVGEVTCFTTRPDTNFGATFVALAPEHPFSTHLQKVLKTDQRAIVTRYVEEAKKKSDADRLAENRKKSGVFTGLFCLNKLTGNKIPLYISDFVLMSVGTGVVVGVPGHDARDFAFAETFKLPIVRVVSDQDTMVNSGFLNGMNVSEAMVKMMDHLESKGWGKRVTTYHLRDWLISRQRYWGPPIPMIFCKACAAAKRGERADMTGWYTVGANELPVLLPRIDDYKPGDDGIAPLAKHKEFYEVTCPGCGGKAVRETDVSDTFLDSSWYFLRYPSVNRDSKSSLLRASKEDASRSDIADRDSLPWNPEITKKWLPVDMYTGGAEHSVLHLLYSRFVTMALHDWGFLEFDEPFTKFYAHGLVIKDGAKMSKSKGNVVNPDEYSKLYGSDALRMYLMFMGPYDQGGDFRDSSMEGLYRWVGRIWRMAQQSMEQSKPSSATITSALYKAIKQVTDDMEKRRYNTAIATMMEFTNLVADEGGVVGAEELKKFICILAPFAPHLTEELWSQINGYKEFKVEQSVHVQPWPKFDESKIVDQDVMIAVQVNGKLRDTFPVVREHASMQNDIETEAKKRENVQKYLAGKTVRKVIFVSGKLINFVVG